mgnify:CR=1 FL=1
MNPKQFLTIGGIVLILLGVLGFFLIGPTADKSIFGEAWWFDNGENWAHLILGVVGVIAAYSFPAGTQKGLVMLLGILALFFAVYNIFSTTFLGANLESPMDLILHAVVGIWALMSVRGGDSSMSSGAPTTTMNPSI